MTQREILIRPHRLKTLVTEDVTYRSSFDFHLTEQDLQQARLELGETEELKDASIKKLRTMLSENQFHFRTEDSFLLRYLRYKKFNCDEAYRMIRNLYNLRRSRADIFSIPLDIGDMLDIGVIKYLPYRDKEGSCILWIDSKKWNLKEITLFGLLQLANAVSDLISMNPSCQVNSIVGLYDLGGVTARHFAQYLYPSILGVALKCLQDTYPWRIKRVLGLNCNKAIRTAYSVFSKMIKKKIADRVILLGSDFSELHPYLSSHILPKEYGGCIEDSECSVTEFVLENLQYLKYERSFGSETTR